MSLSEAVLMIADRMDSHAETFAGPYLGIVKNYAGQLRVAVKAAEPPSRPAGPAGPPWSPISCWTLSGTAEEPRSVVVSPPETSGKEEAG